MNSAGNRGRHCCRRRRDDFVRNIFYARVFPKVTGVGSVIESVGKWTSKVDNLDGFTRSVVGLSRENFLLKFNFENPIDSCRVKWFFVAKLQLRRCDYGRTQNFLILFYYFVFFLLN